MILRKFPIAVAGCLALAPCYAQPSRPAAPAVAQDSVQVPNLTGIRVVSEEGRISNGTLATGIAIEDLPVLNDPALRQQLSEFLNKPATRESLQGIANVITRWYTSKGLPYIRVAFPSQQDLRSGVVQAVVTENPTILPSLTGVRIIDNAAKLNSQGAEPGVSIVGLPILEDPAFRKTIEAFFHKPLTQRSLLELEQAIVTFYGQHDRPYMDIAVPSGQDISNGAIQLVVTESRVGKVSVARNTWFSSELIKSELGFAAGDPISARELREDADWLNQNPFHHQEISPRTLADGTYHVTIQTQRGATPATTDIIVNLPDQFPVRFSASYDNTGPPALTRNRWTLGVDWNNALWLDHELSYRFSSSDDFWSGKFSNPTFTSHFLSYAVPLPWRDRLTLFASYGRAIPQAGPDINITGVNSQASLRYSVQLPPLFGFSPAGGPVFSHELQLGFDYKSGNNNLEFGGFQIFNVTAEVDQFLLVYNAALNDRFGQTSLTNNLVYSPGGLTGANNSALFQAQLGTPFPKASYLYDHLALTRVTVLPAGLDLGAGLEWMKRLTSLTKITAQVSNVNLLPSEQMGIGGVDSVPGYLERQENGSRGLQINEELRSPAWSPTDLILGRDAGDRVQAGLSWNYGNVNELKVLPDTQSTFELESLAASLYYTAEPNLNFRMVFGRQLRKLPEAAHGGDFIHISLRLAY